MKLIENAGPVLQKSYTTWMAVLAFVLGIVEYLDSQIATILPLLKPFISDSQAGLVATLVTALIPIVRVLPQASLQVKKAVDDAVDAMRKNGGV